MQIQQLQVAADPVQDRLLLRISTPSQEEVRVFVTRRFLRELWPHLIGMLFGHLGARPIQLEIREMPATAGSFDAPFENPEASFPLGGTPLLAAEAKLEAAGEGLCRLSLREFKERSFTMTLNADLLQALCSMLRATCEQSKWDLELDYGPPAPAKPRAAARAPTGKTHLH